MYVHWIRPTTAKLQLAGKLLCPIYVTIQRLSHLLGRPGLPRKITKPEPYEQEDIDRILTKLEALSRAGKQTPSRVASNNERREIVTPRDAIYGSCYPDILWL